MTPFRTASDGIKSDNDERIRIILLNGGRRTLEYQDVRSNTLSDWLVRIWQRRTLDYANAYR